MPEAETTRCPANSNASTRLFFTSGSSTASTTMSHPANNPQAEGPSRARCSSRRMTDGFSETIHLQFFPASREPESFTPSVGIAFCVASSFLQGNHEIPNTCPSQKTAQLSLTPPAWPCQMRADANTLHWFRRKMPFQYRIPADNPILFRTHPQHPAQRNSRRAASPLPVKSLR